MTGRRMNADEALRWGIANRVVSVAELMDSARELADQIANSAPLAVAALKRFIVPLANFLLKKATN